MKKLMYPVILGVFKTNSLPGLILVDLEKNLDANLHRAENTRVYTAPGKIGIHKIMVVIGAQWYVPMLYATPHLFGNTLVEHIKAK